MANYLSPKFKGAHLDKYGKMESTKHEIEDKTKNSEHIPEEVDTENTVNDASLSPYSKLVKNHMEKMHRERTLVGVVNNKIRTEMESPKILHWWKQHEAVLHLLTSLAKRILCLPASFAKS